MLVPFSVVPSPRFSYSLYAYVFAWANWLSSLCCAYFASQTPGLCSASILVPFLFCTRLFVLSVCFASQTPGLCSASIFGSLSLCARFFVMSVCFASQTPGLCSAFIFGSLPLLHTFLCFVSVLRLANTGVCAVLLSSVPFPFCTRFFVLSVCFASQTPGLCSASIFGSLPLLHTFICFVSVLRLANSGFVQCFYLGSLSLLHTFLCFVSVLRLANSGFVQCFYLGSLSLLHTFLCFVSVLCLANTGFVLRFPFAHVCLCQCASPCKLRVCAVLFPPSLINLFAFMLCLYFTIDFLLRIPPCKLRVCLGQSQSFYLALLFSEVFCYATFALQISLLSSATSSTPTLNFIAYVFQCIPCACIISRT